jgi:N-acetylmuramoyl-L-alanine amidase
VSKYAVLILCGVLALLAGCATNEPPPTEWSDTNLVQQAENKTAFKPIPPLVQTNRPQLIQINLPPLLKTNALPLAVTNPLAGTNAVKPRPAPVYTFTSLKRWAAEQKLNPPGLISRSPVVAYAVSSPKGVMVLAIGSREAAWNGVTLHLGYAPEIIDGEVFVHSLDLQKSLEPFLCEAPAAYGTNRVIVIDPGHGGINAGTISVTDHRPEKEFTLDWARRLQPLLEQEGWRVFLTRTNDVDVALSNRVTVAENRHADVFISLHFNSMAPDQKPVGLATFCLTPMGLPSNVTRGFPDMLYQGFLNNNFDTQNVQLAEQLQRSLLRATSLEDRGVNRARFIGVLRGQRRPAVLIEAGFMSNPHEAKRIESPDFRQKLAEAVAAALK